MSDDRRGRATNPDSTSAAGERSVRLASPANRRRPSLRPPANRLYAIVDTGLFGAAPEAVTAAVHTLLDCGVRWIQLRAKGVPDLALWRMAEAVGRLFEEAPGIGGGVPDPGDGGGAPDSVGDGAALGAASGEDAPLLWINDDAAVAAALLASGPCAGLPAGLRVGVRVGLHLGQDDLPPPAARLSVPPACPIGRSTHGRGQAAEAEADPAVDVLAIGPVFGTATKERPDPVVGLTGVAEARKVASKPLIGIGGIDAERAPRVIEAGADAVAVVSALDPRRLRESCGSLLRALR